MFPLETAPVERVFNYNGIKLADPSTSMTPDQVREHYAGTYVELNTAVVEGPVLKHGKHTYDFVRSVGTKG